MNYMRDFLMKTYDAEVIKNGLNAFFVKSLDFSNVDLIMDKMDGSLISSYNSEHSVRLKWQLAL